MIYSVTVVIEHPKFMYVLFLCNSYCVFQIQHHLFLKILGK